MLLFDKYLDKKRFRDSGKNSELDYRNPFENDYSRVILSSSFRRLQDKTQVFPLEKEDFVRTRLTHSLEVSNFGRSIGMSLEEILILRKYLSPEKKGMLSSLLATAGLIHDLGNPPFGHFGESAVKDFFIKLFKENKIEDIKELTEQKKKDFETFDGNVQTFRVLKKLQYLKDEHGMNLTFSTLATIVKYPFNSLTGNQDSETELSKTKFGYFQSEEKDYIRIKEHFKLSKRYPFTFLLEAADDIAYSVADIEDACKKDIINEDKLLEILEMELKDATEEEYAFIKIFKKHIAETDLKLKHRFDIAVQKFRIDVQGFMITAVIRKYRRYHRWNI
jgi:dGTPase